MRLKKNIFLILLCITQIIESALDHAVLGALTIEGVTIPAFAKKEKEYSGKKRVNAIVKTAEFHRTHIIPRQIFFNITQAPIICYESNYQSEALPLSGQNNSQTIIIAKQDDIFKNFVIAHEMVHLYVAHKYPCIDLNFEPLFEYFFKCNSILSIVFLAYVKTYSLTIDYGPNYKLIFDLIGLGLFGSVVSHYLACGITLLLSQRQKYYHRIVEFLCDAKGITYGSKEQQLQAIDEGIQLLQKPETLTFKQKFLLLLFGKSHPSHESRIAQLEKLRDLIITDNVTELNAHLDTQEEILENYYESFLTNPKKWLSIRWAKIKTRLLQTKQSIKNSVNFLKNKDESILTPYDIIN